MASISEPIKQYLNHKWPAGLKCPLCEENDWFTTPGGAHSIEGLPASISTDGDPDDWAPSVGVRLLICVGCGFVAPLMDTFVEAVEETS